MTQKVMVVDDDLSLLHLSKTILESTGYEVLTCDNGSQVLPSIAKFQPDLLILDLMLPGIDGYSLQVELAKRPETKDIPIIVISGLARIETLIAKFPKAVTCMSKPWKIPVFPENVKTALAGRRQPSSRPPLGPKRA